MHILTKVCVCSPRFQLPLRLPSSASWLTAVLRHHDFTAALPVVVMLASSSASASSVGAFGFGTMTGLLWHAYMASLHCHPCVVPTFARLVLHFCLLNFVLHPHCRFHLTSSYTPSAVSIPHDLAAPIVSVEHIESVFFGICIYTALSIPAPGAHQAWHFLHALHTLSHRRGLRLAGQ